MSLPESGTQDTSRGALSEPAAGGRKAGAEAWLARMTARVAEAPFAALAVALAVLLVFRLAALAVNATELFVDEAQYWSWSLDPAFGYFSKPPLVAWIIAAVTQVCGHGEACIRLPSPLIHTATSVLVFLIGRRLYSPAAGFWSAVTFATLPGVSLSSGIISTDVPLLFAWSLALLAFVELTERPTVAMAALLGAAIGLGLNAKYAMTYFVPCAAVFFLVAPEARTLLSRPHLYAALALGVLLIVPNLAWNATNGFATLAHTAGNAGWTGSLLHPGKVAEFLLAQFGVFGPILFAVWGVIVWRARRSLMSLPVADRLLLAFSVPLVLAIAVQAFISHAFANWAAMAYVAATVLVCAVLLRRDSWAWLAGSLAVNVAIALVIATATWQAGSFALPGIGDPFARTLGNRAVAAAVVAAVEEEEAAGHPVGSVLTADREITAALLYYAPGLAPRLYQLRSAGGPRDHYELKRPATSAMPDPALLVTRQAAPAQALQNFLSTSERGPRKIAVGRFASRTIHLFVVSGFQGS